MCQQTKVPFKTKYLDILNLRIVTESISDTVFTINKAKFHFFDVSGLKHHRTYWVPYFENVHSILFVVSLAAYNQTMVEDTTMNRMADSIVLFDHIGNNASLANSSIILFFNKRDLYEKKVKKIPISQFFPDFQGKEKSVSAGVKFFDQKFRAQVKIKRTITLHVTCATDTNQMKVIISSVVDKALTNSIKSAGLV